MAATAGPQFDIVYTLVGPSGARAVFNDQADPDYVGALTSISGFDSPEVRESAEDITEFDGGVHGPFYYGRRPLTLEGLIYGHASATARNDKVSKLKRATDALRGDAVLTFQPSGAPSMFISVRRQQPVRIDGPWNKTFQVPLVAADPRFYSSTLLSDSVGVEELDGGPTGITFSTTFPMSYGSPVSYGQLYIDHVGDTETFPVYTITGPGVNPTIFNTTNNSKLRVLQTLNAAQGLQIDTSQRTVKLGTLLSPGVIDLTTTTNRYSVIDFAETEWGGLDAGINDVRLFFDSGSTSASGLKVEWRSAWL